MSSNCVVLKPSECVLLQNTPTPGKCVWRRIMCRSQKKDELIEALKNTSNKFFGQKPEESYNYGKIINEKQFDRVVAYLSQGTIVQGGRSDREKLFKQ